MPVLVGVEAACLVPEGVGLDFNVMLLWTSRQASAWVRGLDNEIVPGKLGNLKTSMSSHRQRKKGEGTLKDAPKPNFNKPIPKSTKSFPKPSAVIEDEAVEPVNVQDKTNEVTRAEAILSSSLIEQQVPLAQSPENPDLRTSFMDILANGHSKIDLAFVLWDCYAGDTLFRKILAKPKDFRNFKHHDGLIFLKLKDRELLCIPNYVHKGRSIKEVVIDEAHSLLAHLGTCKTLAYLQDHVCWKSIAQDVESYCKSCITCKQTRTIHRSLMACCILWPHCLILGKSSG